MLHTAKGIEFCVPQGWVVGRHRAPSDDPTAADDNLSQAHLNQAIVLARESDLAREGVTPDAIPAHLDVVRIYVSAVRERERSKQLGETSVTIANRTVMRSKITEGHQQLFTAYRFVVGQRAMTRVC